jgi:outer membrane immunogenic protein
MPVLPDRGWGKLVCFEVAARHCCKREPRNGFTRRWVRVGALAFVASYYAAPAHPASLDDQLFNPTPASNWSGLYAGFNAGAGWAEAEHDPMPVKGIEFYQSGSVIGGTLGYNWLLGNVVVGLESDLDFARVEGETVLQCASICFSSFQALATLRPRIGITWGIFLPYITFGVASALLHAGQPAYDARDWEPGWTFGGGVEAHFAPHWSLKIEYLHSKVNDIFYNGPVNSGIQLVDVNQHDLNLIRFGVNYFFDWNPSIK